MRMGVRSEMAKLQDLELQRLTRLLPTLVLSSCAESTVSKYDHAFQRWKGWAESNKEITVFAVSEVYFPCTYSI